MESAFSDSTYFFPYNTINQQSLFIASEKEVDPGDGTGVGNYTWNSIINNIVNYDSSIKKEARNKC